MSGSTFGKIFRITTWGESHGSGIGVVIDGCPSGISLNEEDIQIFLDRRKPGQSKFTTRRSEEDTVEILSGIFEGKTTGTPISLLVRNKDQRSRDYGNIVSMFRPGHADYPFTEKYGIRDYRGGGRSSGRETIGRVAAGAIASKILNELGISLCAYTKAIGPYVINETEYNYSEISQNSLYMPNNNIAEQAGQYITSLMKETNSCGGVIECIADGLPVGLGEPVFDKLDATLAHAMMSIPATKAFAVGSGFEAAGMTGLEHNDPFYMQGRRVRTATNHSGGIQGGISSGEAILVRIGFKPTATLMIDQQTVNRDGEDARLKGRGRHDACVLPRAVPIVEAMAWLCLCDHYLRQRCQRAL